MTEQRGYGEPSPARPQQKPAQPDRPGAAAATDPPRTGNPAVDAACASVADLTEVPAAGHYDKLAAAHQALHDALNATSDSPRTS